MLGLTFLLPPTQLSACPPLARDGVWHGHLHQLGLQMTWAGLQAPLLCCVNLGTIPNLLCLSFLTRKMGRVIVAAL